MSVTSIYRWRNGALHALEYCDMTNTSILVADSWLVQDGSVLAIELHRERFLAAVAGAAKDTAVDSVMDRTEASAFWDAALQLIPADGSWFPRVELQLRDSGTLLVLRLRTAPALTRSLRLASHAGDPRRSPLTKGPDTDALLAARTLAQSRGADDAVILSPDGSVVEAAHEALLWWRGDALCAPSAELARVDSVTARSAVTLAMAIGLDVLYESVTPAELDGLELWALNSLHGIRIVTAWIDGPSLAEEPGRLGSWRTRLDRLRRPLISAHS